MSALAHAFTRKRYEMKEAANILDLAFRKFAEYNIIAHVHKKMELFSNFETFLDHYVKLRVRLPTFFSSIRVHKAERGATLV